MTKIKIKGQEYILAGAIKYEGIYKESNGKGKLEYIEWLGYNKKGNIIYISESLAWDSEGVYKSLDYSKKINFPFIVKNISSNSIDTNIGRQKVKEIDEVSIVSITGHVNKKYKIGEKVRLWKFNNYFLEEEKGKNHIERNLYLEENLNKEVNNNSENSLQTKLIQIATNILQVLILFIFICQLNYILGFIVLLFVLVNIRIHFFAKIIIIIMAIIIMLLFCKPSIHNILGNTSLNGSYFNSSRGSSSYGGGK